MGTSPSSSPSPSSVPQRSEIDEAYRWDLDAMFPDREAWEAAYEAVADRLDELSAYEGRAAESAATLRAVLELRDELSREVANVTAYARMRRDEDTRDDDAQAMAARAKSLSADAEAAASFVEPAIQSLSRAEIDRFVGAEPALGEYDHYFDDVLRTEPHTRSAEVEELLADLSEVTGGAGDVYRMLSNADMEFPAVEAPDGDARTVTLSNFTTLQKHPDRDFRRRVHEAFYDEWATVRNAVASTYRTQLTADVTLAETRGYGTAREAALDEANVPVAVYDTLVETVRENLDVLGRHAALKRDALGVDELAMWDLYAPLTEGESPEVPYERATELVTEAVAPLGDDYRDRLAAGLDARWIDVYETEGKRSGAYSGGTYDSHPYVLMNYQEDVSSMFTLAHELGHAMHSELTSEHQPYVYADYDIFVAEVASTVNEALLTAHLLETVEDDRFRRHVLDVALERFRSTLFRQTMFAEFEGRAHAHVENGGAVTPDWLDETYRELKSRFYGPARVDDRIVREWMRIPHFYYGFYVYQYATGISAANAIAAAIREEGEPAAERYRAFLRSGSRGYPLDLLDTAGVDMTDPAPVEAAIDAYDGLLDEFERLAA